MRVWLAAFVIVGLTCPSFGAGDEGVSAYNSGNYELALKELHPMAEAGDSRAQWVVGVMYDQGRGIGRDRAQAAQWYRRSAEQGNARAQTSLGYLYQIGQGVPQDRRLAVQWFQKAAD